jgi:hypothetical protein
MNIALEQTEELVNGVITNRYGDAFVRGNNGSLVVLTFLCLVLTFSPSSTLHLGCRGIVTYIRIYPLFKALLFRWIRSSVGHWDFSNVKLVYPEG